MLTPGNAQLGTGLIWGFGLPSGTASVCVGMSRLCKSVCYAVRTEQYRPSARKRYQRNLELSRRKGFARRVRAFLIAHHIRVVRIHTGGEFYGAKYIRKWRAIIQRSPRVKFFTYTRAWRISEFRTELEWLAELPNLQLWYSADRETGLPDSVPAQVRIAWLMAGEDDLPPADGRIDLIFRVRQLRSVPLAEWNDVPICPAESGRPGPKSTCDRCRLCWKSPTKAVSESRLLSLPLIVRKESDDSCSDNTAIRAAVPS